MRIGIMTFLHNSNYGSSLQAYALQRVLRELGHDAEHLDYQPDRNEKIRNLIASGNSPKLILEGIRKRNVQSEQAGARAKKDAISAFYAREMRLSAPCRNREELRRACDGLDLLLCGSDQIWNPVWLNPAYFLDFAPSGIRKLAYAPSMGVKTLEDRRKRGKIRRLTADFEAISAREQEGADLLRAITGRDAAVLPDPVCLLTPEEWKEAGRKAPLPSAMPEGGCLLCYFIGENPAYWPRVRALAAETGLKVRVIPVTAEGYASGYELLDGLGPEGFLNAVSGAACLCTDSFHGLVFGTIFGVRTELLRRDRDGDPESKNSRVDHFLRQIRERSATDLRAEGLAWLRKNI